AYNHSEHYFHSGYADLIITGLVGLRPRADDVIDVHPLAPESWDYFALEGVWYHGRSVSVVWDRHGTRYKLGKGFHVLVNGEKVATAERLRPLTAKLTGPRPLRGPIAQNYNFAVHNDGHYFPRATASYTSPGTALGKVIDGNYWYDAS